MPDFFGVYDDLKVTEYLDFYAGVHEIENSKRPSLIDELLELVNLSDKKDFFVDNLSRGMKQRLCLARSLIHDPNLLILDEPASGLDPKSRVDMKLILKSLKDMGKTILISSHILPELAELCSSIGIIAVAFIQLFLIAFILPPMACGTISGEKSRQTFDLLLCTRMTYLSIISGKIQTVILHILLLIFASFPVLSLAYVYGGTNFLQLGVLILFYFSTALMVTSLGVFFSSIFKKTVVAIIASYLFLIIINIITFIALVIYHEIFVEEFTSRRIPTNLEALLFLFSNTFYGFISIFQDSNIVFRQLTKISKDALVKPWMIVTTYHFVFSFLLILISKYIINPLKGYGKRS